MGSDMGSGMENPMGFHNLPANISDPSIGTWNTYCERTARTRTSWYILETQQSSTAGLMGSLQILVVQLSDGRMAQFSPVMSFLLRQQSCGWDMLRHADTSLSSRWPHVLNDFSWGWRVWNGVTRDVRHGFNIDGSGNTMSDPHM